MSRAIVIPLVKPVWPSMVSVLLLLRKKAEGPARVELLNGSVAKLTKPFKEMVWPSIVEENWIVSSPLAVGPPPLICGWSMEARMASGKVTIPTGLV